MLLYKHELIAELKSQSIRLFSIIQGGGLPGLAGHSSFRFYDYVHNQTVFNDKKWFYCTTVLYGPAEIARDLISNYPTDLAGLT